MCWRISGFSILMPDLHLDCHLNGSLTNVIKRDNLELDNRDRKKVSTTAEVLELVGALLAEITEKGTGHGEILIQVNPSGTYVRGGATYKVN